MLPPKRYRAIIFHPGSKTLWRTGRDFPPTDPLFIPILTGVKQPDPAEVVLEREFRFQMTAAGWARAHLKRLKNVCAEIHDTHIDG